MKVAVAVAMAAATGCRPNHHLPGSAAAENAAQGPVILHNGANTVDLLGDGTPAKVFVAWRGNYNAHGYSAAGIYLETTSDLSDSRRDWQIVPRFGGPYVPDDGRDLYTTSEGADCTLGDMRLVQHRGEPAQLVIARRELGKSFADSAVTHFDYYQLTRNTNGTVGWPPYYFQFVRTVDAHRQYCDVNVAFDQELHLGTHGLGHGEGGQ